MNLLLRFIVCNNHAHTLVEETGFVEFQKSVNPKVKILSAASMKAKILDTEENMRSELKEYFEKKNVGIPSATIDSWALGNQLSIMTVTMSWIDDEFVLREIVIGFREVIGKNLCRAFLNILEDFSITKVKH
jgi:hypothetical protein